MSKKQAAKRARGRDAGGGAAQRTAADRLRAEQAARDAAWRRHRIGTPDAPAVTDDPLRGLFRGGGGMYDTAFSVNEGDYRRAPKAAEPRPTRIRSALDVGGGLQFKEGFYMKIDGPAKRRRRLYLTVPELAEVLRCSYDKAHDLTDSRRLPSHRPTGEIRVPVAAVVAYLRETALEAAVPGESAQGLDAMIAEHRAHIEDILDREPSPPAQPLRPAQPAQTA